MAWYWIALIGLVAFVSGFTAALFWLRDTVRRYRKKPAPLPHYTPSDYRQMNPYMDLTTSKE